MTAFTILTPADMHAVLTEYTGRPDRRCDNEVSDGPSEPVVSQDDCDRRGENDYQRWLERDARWVG